MTVQQMIEDAWTAMELIRQSQSVEEFGDEYYALCAQASDLMMPLLKRGRNIPPRELDTYQLEAVTR